MINFIKADLLRVFTKPLRCVMLCIFAISMIGILIYQSVSGYTDVSLTSMMVGGNPVYGILVMLAYIFTIFGDDFRAKNLQAAIGMGVLRYQVVLGKFMTYSIIMFIDTISFALVHTLIVGIMGHLVTGEVLIEIFVDLACELLKGILAMSIAMMAAFVSQSVTVASLVYALMYINVLGIAMPYLMVFKMVGELKIPTHYSSIAVQNFVNRLWLGIFDIDSFIVIALYLAVGLGVSILVFSKRELDF